MKIIVLHGEDIVKSYERLKRFTETARARSWEVANLDESETAFEENLSSPSLFGTDRFFILRDIRKLGKKEVEWLGKKYADLSGTLIIYHEGQIGQTFIKNLPKETKTEEFKLPKLIWNFLEHIYPGNSATVIKEFHTVIEREATEFVFTLIARQLKNLYYIKSAPKRVPFQDWQIARLKRQAEKFTPEQLRELIGMLAEIDIKVKTSKADLVSSLDLLIVKQLE